MLVSPASAKMDGNSPKTYIIGTTPAEKEALRVKKGEDAVEITTTPQLQDITPSQKDREAEALFIELDKHQPPLEHRLADPSALDILKQIEQ